MIDPKHYIPVNSPYPAHLFHSTHPMRPADKTTDLGKLFDRQRTTAPVKRIYLKQGDDYQREQIETAQCEQQKSMWMAA